MRDITPSAAPHYSPTMSLLAALQSELRLLYEEETKSLPVATTVSGHGAGLGVTDSGRLSTYCQALTELCLAIAEVTPLHPAPSTGVSVKMGVTPEPEATSSLTSLTSTQSALSKRKKVKARRGHSSSGVQLRRSDSPHAASASASAAAGHDVDVAAALSSPVDVDSALSLTESADKREKLQSEKPEEMLWYHRAITMSHILRFITDADTQVRTSSRDALPNTFRIRL